jgi:hypothetical protein
MNPADLGVATEMINRLTAACARMIDYFHVPVPIDRDDPPYYAPLAALTLGPRTELYIGLIHFADGIDGAQRRIAAARGYVADFGVATECGFGRRAPETIEPLLALHADVAALVA